MRAPLVATEVRRSRLPSTRGLNVRGDRRPLLRPTVPSYGRHLVFPTRGTLKELLGVCTWKDSTVPLPPNRCRKDGCTNYQPCAAHPKGWGSSASRPLPSDWKARVRRVKQFSSMTCYICGAYSPDGQVDHVVPRAEGGLDDYSNYEWICPADHKIKSQEESKRGIRRAAKRRRQEEA